MELELSDVDIAATVEHAAEGIRERLSEGGIALKLDLSRAGESFSADAHRLTQILFNLLSNAANFAPEGSAIDLRVTRNEEAIAFAVTDRGPGIAAEKVARMFERFEADPSGGRHSGAGLGLSIVKSFVELHQGAIAVDSAPGRGTTITCTFPLRPEGPGRRRLDGDGEPFEDAAE